MNACLLTCAFIILPVALSFGGLTSASNEEGDCGFRAYQAACKLLGKTPNLRSQLISQPIPEGVSMLRLKNWLTQEGLNVTGISSTIDNLNFSENIYIAHTSDQHFLVAFARIGDSLAVINDGSVPHLMPIAELLLLWSGNALQIERHASEQIPEVVFSAGAIRFGSISPYEKKSVSISLQNISGETVTIKQIATSCSCLLTSNKPPLTIASNKTIDISLSFVGSADVKPINNIVLIAVKGKSESVYSLPATGMIEGTPSTTPPIINFGQLERGEQGKETLVFHDAEFLKDAYDIFAWVESDLPAIAEVLKLSNNKASLVFSEQDTLRREPFTQPQFFKGSILIKCFYRNKNEKETIMKIPFVVKLKQ